MRSYAEPTELKKDIIVETFTGSRRQEMTKEQGLVKKEFDFGWKKWKTVPLYAELTLKHQKGDILDVGCATCELYRFLREKGWENSYFGIDSERYEGFEYPKGANLVMGDALKLQFPRVDTVTLYNILEHVDDPVALLRKSLDAAKHSVLVFVPKRNEDLWKLGLVEFHQLDKSHRHCGFSEEEISRLVAMAGGKIVSYEETNETNVMAAARLWKGRLPRYVMSALKVFFSSRRFFQEAWCEVVRG